MAKVIDGKRIAGIMKDKMKDAIAALPGRKPGLAVIIVGSDPASQVYVGNKVKDCVYTGVVSFHYELPETTGKDELINLIEKLNKDNTVDGILVQLPLPKHLDEKEILGHIDPNKDVDGFGVESAGLLAIGTPKFVACTPLGVIKLLEYYNINMSGKNAVVIGRSNIVGKPMAQLLLMNNSTVTICHSKTKDIKAVTRGADILVVAIGRPRYVTADMVKEGAVVVDVGMNKVDGKLCGDVDYDAVEKIASYITPVPGGVGLMTRAMLLFNTIKAFEIHESIKVPLGF
jgi:methylenetetrahydrofolate dehydrogenase (NADP+)/methenyltetrahydrofolate cyclohydrolase